MKMRGSGVCVVCPVRCLSPKQIFIALDKGFNTLLPASDMGNGLTNTGHCGQHGSTDREQAHDLRCHAADTSVSASLAALAVVWMCSD